MSFDPGHEDGLARLAEQLRHAPSVTADLVSAVIAEACTRLPALDKSGPVARLHRLIAAGAWSDAALALIALELPTWTLRRLVYEDSEWLCSLSRNPTMPVALDDSAEASHPEMPLSILSAFVEARRMTSATRAARAASAPRIAPQSACTACCDNFA